MQTVIFRVVGVSFTPGYPANLKRLRHAMEEVQSHRVGTQLEGQQEGPAVVLIRNPQNKHDANAIEVHVPALGKDDGMIGHVPKAIAARWAPKLDAGETPMAWVDFVAVKEGHDDRPGIDVKTRWP